MNKEELTKKLAGDYHPTITGVNIPKDSINLAALVDILLEVLGDSGDNSGENLRPGVVKLANGRYMRDGKFIKEAEAIE